MNNVDDEGYSSDLSCSTPLLSPSKTVSTEGWMSPKSPVSPRKTQGCLLFRDIGDDTLVPKPPYSPSKVKNSPHLNVLHLSDAPRFNPYPVSPPFDDDSLVKRRLNFLDGTADHRHSPFSCTNNGSSLDADFHIDQNSDQSLDETPNHAEDDLITPIELTKRNERSLNPDSKTDTYPSPPHTPAIQAETNVDALERIASIDTNNTPSSPNRLSQLPLRHVSSPLRPSQWTTRGGLLSSPPHPGCAPDRFISSRRPPTVTRDSFEMNRPTQRTANEETTSIDPFGRQLRRSRRLNDELRSLRETHSVLTGRMHIVGVGRSVHAALRHDSIAMGTRQISAGAVWNVGGSFPVGGTVTGVSNGRGGLLGSGTNAPLYTSLFLSRSDPEAELEAYECRLLLALNTDQSDRILEHSLTSGPLVTGSSNTLSPTSRVKHVWMDSAWIKDSVGALLDAPQLRDDYYCSLLAYSHTAKCLAVGLGNFVHLWSERKGVDTPESLNSLTDTNLGESQHVTSLAFSSTQGGQAILAVGRADGRIALWSPLDTEPRFDATQPKPISCVAFRPIPVKRPSMRDPAMVVATEELLVGDEAGHIYFYSIEWPSEMQSAIFGWNGAMTLLARMAIHSQQICGLAWSADGEAFASGGNDNACYLFETKRVLTSPFGNTDPASPIDVRHGPNDESIYTVIPGRGTILHISPNQAKHKWELNAAVKAIAFCPWQRGLLAVGGGSNDRCIHFYHAISGACLATIDCAAQVTSLIWSQTRREIAATFGFAQPEHPYRIAVFAWPSCEQVVSVPWFDENRALYAVAYPGSADPALNGETSANDRTAAGREGAWWRLDAVEDGCIVVAASDAAIRFHEIWTGDRKSVGGGPGQLGGSVILEGLHGIEREDGPVVR